MSQLLKEWAMEEMGENDESVQFPPEYEQDTEELEFWRADNEQE